MLSDVSSSLVAVVIPEGAHHLDLMFSNPADPPSVKAARALERAHIKAWIEQANAASSPPSPVQLLLDVRADGGQGGRTAGSSSNVEQQQPAVPTHKDGDATSGVEAAVVVASASQSSRIGMHRSVVDGLGGRGAAPGTTAGRTQQHAPRKVMRPRSQPIQHASQWR